MSHANHKPADIATEPTDADLQVRLARQPGLLDETQRQATRLYATMRPEARAALNLEWLWNETRSRTQQAVGELGLQFRDFDHLASRQAAGRVAVAQLRIAVDTLNVLSGVSAALARMPANDYVQAFCSSCIAPGTVHPRAREICAGYPELAAWLTRLQAESAARDAFVVQCNEQAAARFAAERCEQNDKNAHKLLIELAERGVHLALKSGSLTAHPGGLLTDGDREGIKAHAEALKKLLALPAEVIA